MNRYLALCRRYRGVSYAWLAGLLFLLTGLVHVSHAQGFELGVRLMLSAVIVLATLTISTGLGLGLLALGLAAIKLGSLWGAGELIGSDLNLSLDRAGSLFFLLVVVQMARYMTDQSHGLWGRVWCAVSGYLVSIWLFAGVYEQVLRVNPEAWRVTAAHTDVLAGEQLTSMTIYFSVITQTTVGFGDVTPVSGVMKGLVTVQVLFGVLYLALAIARLVGQSGQDNSRPGQAA